MIDEDFSVNFIYFIEILMDFSWKIRKESIELMTKDGNPVLKKMVTL